MATDIIVASDHEEQDDAQVDKKFVDQGLKIDGTTKSV